MTSELAEFFATLLRIAKFILDVTLTLICSALLLLASVLPWRLPFIVLELVETCSSLTFQKFQKQAARQFLFSLGDVVIFALVLASLFWPPRWPGLLHTLKLAAKPPRDEDDDSHSGYNLETRFEWIMNAFESYADILLFPLVLVLLLAPWRWLLRGLKLQNFQKSMERAKRSDRPCARMSAFRNWAAWEGINAIMDLPFVVLGLASAVIPTRIKAFISVLLRIDLEDDLEDCEARVYLAMLPILSICDMLAAALAFLAIVNPLRCGAFLRLMSAKWNDKLETTCNLSPDFQKVVLWNARLRSIAIRSGLASLLDLLLLPLGLMVCITLYRAGPLVSAMCSDRVDREPSAAGLTAQEAELPGPVHQMALKQSTLLLCDLLTLPSFVVVFLTRYRYPFMKAQTEELQKSWGPVAHHVAALINSLVLLHDVVLALCMLPLLLTMYRWPKVYQLLRNRWVAVVPLPPVAESDPEAADGIEAPTAFCGIQTRLKLWQELGNLLLDLPLLPLLLIVIFSLWRADLVLQQCWSAEDNCQRRKAVILQFLELLRDVLGFLALLVVCITLLRMPKVLLDIYSQRARRTTGDPRFTLQGVSLRSGGDGDQRLAVQAEGLQLEARDLKDIGTIRINVVSKSFWEEISRVFGASVASLGKALLPFTLKDGKHVKYSDFYPQQASIELRLGGRELKSKLLQLEGSLTFCVQLEHRSPRGSEEVLARLPIPARLLQQAVNQPGETVQVPQELLTVSPESVCGDLLSGAGIRNAMWLSAFSEFWQLLLDVAHLLLFLCLALAPWRLLQCVYFACRPSQVWRGTLARQLSSLLLVKEAMLKIYRRELEPLLNAAAKDPPFRTSEKLREVAAKLLGRLPMPGKNGEMGLLSELQASNDEVAMAFVEKVKNYSFLQNAVSSYWPGLTLGANLLLLKKSFNPQEHALSLEKIASAQSRADDLLLTLAAEVQAASVEFHSPNDAGLLSSACRKPLSEHRRLVQIFACEVLKDYGTLLLGFLLLISVYRLPAVVEGLRQERQADFVQRMRIVLGCQVRLFMWDLWMLFTAILASLLAIVTLVRALEFLRTAFLHCESLEDLRREAWDATKDALNSIGELFILLTFWDSYKTLVYASIFAVLLPAWGLTLLPIWMRIVLWLALCFLPFLLPSASYALWTFAVVVAMFFLIALVKKGSGSGGVPAHLKTMRVSGMNVLVLLSIFADAALLSSLTYLEPVLQMELCFYIATGITIAWLVVMSMPHAMSSDQNCLKSGKFHVALQLLRRCLLPAAVVLLMQMDGEFSRVACLLLAFLSFTSVLGLDLLSQDHLPDAIGLDLVQPPAFLAGLIFVQMVFTAAQNMTSMWPQCAAAVLMPAWVMVFQCLGGIGGPLWVLPLQLGTSTVVLWSALVRAMPAMSAVGGAAVVTLCAVIAMLLSECLAQRRRREAMEKAGVAKVLRQILDKLTKKGMQLENHHTPQICDTLSPQSVAKELQAFEESTRMEGLSVSFLQNRKEWLATLRRGRNDYEMVAECGHQLLEGVCTPPSTLQIFLLMRRRSGRRIPTAIWQIILEYLSDVRYVSKMLGAVVNHFGSGGPGQQLLRAWQVMDNLGQRVAATTAVMDMTQSQILSHSLARVGLPVTVESAAGPSWRGRVVGTTRNGVWVEALDPSSWRNGREAKGIFQFDKVRMEKQSLEERIQEDLQIWWREARGLYGDGCRCGRPLHPPTRGVGWCDCFRRRKYQFCCQNCWASNYNPTPHSDGCNARTARSKDFSGPRRLAPGCPRAVELTEAVAILEPATE